MSTDDDDRNMRAALSLFVAGALPDDLVAAAHAYGFDDDGWVFPADATVSTYPARDLPEDMPALGRELRRRAAEAGVVQLVPGDPGWPAGTGGDRLPCLWVLGQVDVAGLLRQAITVTGARGNSAYGQHVATDISYALATFGWTVVTGAALGIDTHVAKAGLAAGRPVLVVASEGLDRSHPVANADLLRQVAEGGAVVSAFPPGCPPTRARWAVRERLLGTLTVATVVVEALRLAAERGIAGAVAFADPIPRVRQTAAGPVFLSPGHSGTLYQACTAIYTGLATPRSLIILKDATVLPARAVAKVVSNERGARGVIARLVALGAQPPAADQAPRAWLDTALRDIGATRLRHPGNHRYLFRVGSPARRRRTVVALPALAYPKRHQPSPAIRAAVESVTGDAR